MEIINSWCDDSYKNYEVYEKTIMAIRANLSNQIPGFISILSKLFNWNKKNWYYQFFKLFDTIILAIFFTNCW